MSDTGAGPTLVYTKMLPPYWRSFVTKYLDTTLITAASNNPFHPLGFIPLLKIIGDLTQKIQFLVLDNLAVFCILVTSFIDLLFKAILPRRRKVTYYDAPAIETISRVGNEKSSEGKGFSLPNKLWVSQLRRIPPMSQAAVLVHTEATELKIIRNSHRTVAENHLLMGTKVPGVILAKRTSRRDDKLQFPTGVASQRATSGPL